jgi:hypothetical protein
MAEAAGSLVEPNRRRVILVATWAAAGLLILGQYAWLRHIFAQYRQTARRGGELILPSQDWRLWGIMVPLALIALALLMHRRWAGEAGRRRATLGLVAMLPLFLLGWCVSHLAGSEQLDSVRLKDGRRFLVAIAPVMTDFVYDLREQVGPMGMYWRAAGNLDYSEDGRFTAHPHLVVSSDGQWLLFARGGIFTDCFAVRPDRLKPCQVGPWSSWNSPAFERDMLAKSARISALTGIRP